MCCLTFWQYFHLATLSAKHLGHVLINFCHVRFAPITTIFVQPQQMARWPRGDVTRPGQLGSSGGSGDLVRATTRPECARTGWSLPTQPNSGFPKFFCRHPAHPRRCLSVFYLVRHPVGEVPHDKSTVGAASWSRPARWQAQPRLVQGRQRESL